MHVGYGAVERELRDLKNYNGFNTAMLSQCQAAQH